MQDLLSKMSTTLLKLLFVISSSIVSAKELNVLFLGNSYTYVNDVPKMVQNLAHAAGHTLTYDQHKFLNSYQIHSLEI